MSIPLVIMAVYKYEIINLPEINFNVKIWIVGVLIGTGILNYFLLARKKQHVKIVEEFKLEREEKRKKGMLYAVLYLIISLGIPLYIFLFTIPK
jgi:beta-lactamase regulating signal transducer with metallopeptidase domain